MAQASERFLGRHFVVTGAGTGIGRAIAQRLASEGARLSLMGRRLEPLEESAALCGEGASVFSCDLRERAAVDAAFAAAAAAAPLDGLVANAGVGGPNEDGAQDRFDDLVATNLSGTYYSFRAAARHLRPGPEARHLVAISSILARIGVPAYSGYCASKAGILGLVRALAAELAPENVQVNALCPGWVNTSMALEGLEGMAAGMGVSLDEARAIAMQAVPMGRMSEPEDVAGMVAWLVSADSRGVSGQGLDINGGAWM